MDKGSCGLPRTPQLYQWSLAVLEQPDQCVVAVGVEWGCLERLSQLLRTRLPNALLLFVLVLISVILAQLRVAPSLGAALRALRQVLESLKEKSKHFLD